jgi:hypothetical protein
MPRSRLDTLAQRIDALPPAPRYALYGAALVELLILVGVVLQFSSLIQGRTPWWAPLAALAVGPVLGGTGGLVYGVFGLRLRQHGRLGALAAGIITVAAYVLPFAAVLWIPIQRDIGTLLAVAVWLGTTLLYGCALGVFFARRGR